MNIQDQLKKTLASVQIFFKDRPLLSFGIILLAVFGLLDYYEILFYRPQSVHQWAQCDRGSIARNYAEESMNFFLPRVHHSRDLTGITGLEFPLLNYVAAIFYKLFGFNEFWYRFTVLSTITSAVLLSFRFAYQYLTHFWLAASAVLIWYLSPVLNYYSPNFIPDTGSLGFALLSWVYFFSAEKSPARWKVYAWFLFATLAALIKVTSGVSTIAVLVLLMLDQLKWFGLKGSIPYKKEYGLLAVVSFIAVFGWYYWAAYITEKYGAKFFAQEAAYPKSWQEVKDAWAMIENLFARYYYSYTVFGFLAVALILSFVFAKKNNPLLVLATALLFLGNVCVMGLFFMQYREHDYYIIVLLIPFLFTLIMTGKLLFSFEKKYLRYGAIAIFLGFAGYSLRYSKKFQYDRYHSWMNNPVNTFPEYWDMEPVLRDLGIKRNDRIVSLFDYSTNISLYMLNQKGWILRESETLEQITPQLQAAKYAVVNNIDKVIENDIHRYFDTLLFTNNKVYVFKLSDAELPDSLLIDIPRIK